MLEYGFSHETSSAEIKAASKTWYEALSANEQAFFHQILPWMMVGTGVNKICSQTVQLFTARLEVSSPGWIAELAKALGLPEEGQTEAFTKLLSDKFVGFFSNVAVETNAEWVKRQTRNLPKSAPDAADDKLRFAVRAARLPEWKRGDCNEAQRCFEKERAARIAATPARVEVEVLVG